MARDREPEPKERSAFVGGLILLALAVAVYLIREACVKWIERRDREWAVAYLEPGAANRDTPIRLGGKKVGSVVAVDRPNQRVWLEVRSGVDKGILDAAHLAGGDSTTLVRSIPVARPTTDSLVVDTIVYLRGENGVWSGPCGSGGKQSRAPETRCPLRVGNTIARRGSTTVVWLGEHTVSRLLIALDTSDVREAFADQAVTPGSGFQLLETGAFGIGKQGLRLEVPPDRRDVLPRRTVSYRRMNGDTVETLNALELVTTSNLDMQQARAMLAYLADPSTTGTGPETRFEQAVTDVNRALTSMRSSVDRLDRVSAIDGGQGAVTRLTLSPKSQAELEAALRNLPALMDQAQELLATTEVTVDSTGRSVRQLASRIDTTLTRLEPSVIAALEGARNVEDSLVVLSRELGSAVASARKGAKPVGIALLIALTASTLLSITRLAQGH